jgi:uroporphyrinogen III methyltransferase/synthase
MTARVHLVGAGPGDPGLLTVRARALLERADVVVHDALVPARLLEHVRPGAEIVAVGPPHGDPRRLSQDDVQALLIERARSGRTVVRLKNGDPMLFGRGGEEAAALRAAGVPFDIVPGVTSALAVPAYAGIPVTHRDHASLVTVVTGHQAAEPGGEAALPDVDWDGLARSRGTLVFLMGVRQLGAILEALTAHGLASATPAALVRWGTTGRQRTLVATVGTLEATAHDEAMGPPAVLVVGSVVSLREQIGWYETRPLLGRRIVVTRARPQAGTLAERLEALGADVLSFPTIQLVSYEDRPAVRRMIAAAPGYDWVVLTSVNGVRVFFDAFAAGGGDVRRFGGTRFAAIGSETARMLEARLIHPEVVPADFRAEALADALEAHGMAGARVLLPRAAGARTLLPERLRALGATVDDVATYEAVLPTDADVEGLLGALGAGGPRGAAGALALTFTSSSTVRHFMALIGPAGGATLREHPPVIACIGPITAETAREYGLPVHVRPDVYTIDGLCAALVDHFCKDAGDPLSP